MAEKTHTAKIYTAPPDSGTAVLGKTLPDLLYEAVDTHGDLPDALSHPQGDGWRAWSLGQFKQEVEELALGLGALGLERGDKVALFMHDDVFFALADMGCLLAGLVDAPIYLTHAPEQIQYVIAHSEARALFVTDHALMEQVAGLLPELPDVHTVVVAETAQVPPVPEGVAVHDFASVRARGREVAQEQPDAAAHLRAAIDPHDLATLIYTSGTTGQPKGVMLSHENISHNALTSFSGLPDLKPGGGEVCLSFLPLTHVFARTLHYGAIYHGCHGYYTTPEDLARDLQRVQPTILATVPRVLEKVYGSILKKATEMKGVKKALLNWALALADRYELGTPTAGLYRAELALADRLVFTKWRDALGGRMKYVICGGAALSGKLANLFAAAGVTVLQGYGLTETSPVITYNRPDRNRAGTVGVPIPPVEVTLAPDGEILTRGPHIMQGYFKDAEKTHEVIDDDGWFHTGDVGAFTDEGFLRITDRKKDLFKLSTGKYVMPQPLENRLTLHPMVEQAVVVGAGYKFCTALIFPEQEALKIYARSRGIDTGGDVAALVTHPRVVRRYQRLVDDANKGMDHWSTIKRFSLIPDHLSVDNGMLTPTMKVRRSAVRETYADAIEELYARAEAERKDPEHAAA